ncbi:MAG: tryptophan synthase subunit alpha [Ilumatobacteraceae bacterium]
MSGSYGRIETEFRAKRADGRKLLVPYITGGYLAGRTPSGCAANGADAAEIGVPFSDPVMDGPVIQQAVAAASSTPAPRHLRCSTRSRASTSRSRCSS